MTLSKTYKKSKIKYPILAAMNLITYNKKKNTHLLGIKIIHSETGYRKSVKFTGTVKSLGNQRVKVNCKLVIAHVLYFRSIEI